MYRDCWCRLRTQREIGSLKLWFINNSLPSLKLEIFACLRFKQLQLYNCWKSFRPLTFYWPKNSSIGFCYFEWFKSASSGALGPTALRAKKLVSPWESAILNWNLKLGSSQNSLAGCTLVRWPCSTHKGHSKWNASIIYGAPEITSDSPDNNFFDLIEDHVD